jgi:hypothetical protein
MNLFTFLSKIFNWKKKLNKDRYILYEAVSPEDIKKEQEAKDLAELSKFENKIRTNSTEQQIDTQHIPEYVDGLSIKNPFVGE